MKIMLLILLSFTISSCSSSRPSTDDAQNVWISGFKVESFGGVGKSINYLVNYNANFEEGRWENFYTNIDGFTFEEGVLKQIKIKKENIDPALVPADASTIKYTFVQELQRVADTRFPLNGGWIATEINDKKLEKKIEPPTLSIDLEKMQVSGFDGCNTFVGTIENLTTKKLRFGELVSTEMACFKEDRAYEFYKAMKEVHFFYTKDKVLYLLDGNNKQLLMFLPQTKSNSDY